MDYSEIISELKLKRDPKNIEGMARFGITSRNTLGIPIPYLRKMATRIGKNQKLSEKLWQSDIHEARMLAAFIGEPELVKEGQMERWVRDFDSWDICDQVCGNLFDRSKFAYKKALQWSSSDKEFIKRAGFVLMATLAVHDKDADNKKFTQFFSIIKAESTDKRNFVRKAVNWSLRQIGKRNKELNLRAIKVSKELKKSESSAARWIGSDALRELESPAVRKRIW